MQEPSRKPAAGCLERRLERAPNVRNGSVERVAARGIGQETVRYVPNIFRYCLACKMTMGEKAPPRTTNGS